MSEIEISSEVEAIASAMLLTRGDLAKASREDTVPYNAMSLRAIVKDNPEIRMRYHELLVEELQDKGLHIAERILKMAELQEAAFGGSFIDDNGDEQPMPADPITVIRLSQEISRLITEGRMQVMSSKTASMLVNKEEAVEILAKYLDS